MAEDPPYSLDFFQTIVDVHFGNIYLIVILTGGNESFSGGPYGASPETPMPAVIAKETGKGVKLLDVFSGSPLPNGIEAGFISCFIYAFEFPGESIVESWIRYAGPATGDPPTHGPGGQYAANWAGPDTMACDKPDSDPAAPVDFVSSASVARVYLFSIPEGEKLVTIGVSGLMAETFAPNIDTANLITTSGSRTISAAVYSRVKGSVKKVLQLVDVQNDGKPRPTEDDRATVGVPGGRDTFMVNVHLDDDPAHAQIDNYGKSFQPYKVTFSPSEGFADHIPSQPPPRLR